MRIESCKTIVKDLKARSFFGMAAKAKAIRAISENRRGRVERTLMWGWKSEASLCPDGD
jgi:hypothetical protein